VLLGSMLSLMETKTTEHPVKHFCSKYPSQKPSKCRADKFCNEATYFDMVCNQETS
jgi:hypothetical protein